MDFGKYISQKVENFKWDNKIVEKLEELSEKSLTFVSISSLEVDDIVNDLEVEVVEKKTNFIKFKNTLTNDLLKKLLFKWPKINYKYIKMSMLQQK